MQACKSKRFVVIFFSIFFHLIYTINLCVQPSIKDINSEKYQYDLSCVAMFQDEARFLKEWLEFHKLVGIQHFYLYNNNSIDNYLEVLKSYIESGEVELIDWPYQTSSGYWINIQCNAYEDALEHSRGVSKWLVCLDLDEFIFPVKDNNLVEFLVRYEKFGGIGVNWQLYGTSHVEKVLPGELTIENLIFKAVDDYSLHRRVKSIVRPEFVKGCQNPHFFLYKDGYFHVTPRMERFNGCDTPYVAIEEIRINHYWTRDEDYFKNEKIPKRLRHGDKLEYIIERYNQLNEVKDEAIKRFIPDLKKRMKFGDVEKGFR